MNGNLFSQIPADLPEELTEILHQQANLRIERIVSKAHHSPDDFWYCQSQHYLGARLNWPSMISQQSILRPEIICLSRLSAAIVLAGQPAKLKPSGWRYFLIPRLNLSLS